MASLSHYHGRWVHLGFLEYQIGYPKGATLRCLHKRKVARDYHGAISSIILRAQSFAALRAQRYLAGMAKTQGPVNALLVIDMQVDFISGSLAVPDGPSVINAVKEIVELPFHARYASKDWHPPGHISFASAHPGKAPFGLTTIYPPERLVIAKGQDPHSIEQRGLEQVLWPDHCVQGTFGAQLVEPLREDQFDAIVLKGMDPGVECYSAFKDPWGLLVSNLEALLREKGVTDLYVVGVAGDYCVKESAIDAAKFGAWRTWVVREGVRSVSTDGKEWDVLKAAGVGIIDTVGDLKARLGV